MQCIKLNWVLPSNFLPNLPPSYYVHWLCIITHLGKGNSFQTALPASKVAISNLLSRALTERRRKKTQTLKSDNPPWLSMPLDKNPKNRRPFLVWPLPTCSTSSPAALASPPCPTTVQCFLSYQPLILMILFRCVNIFQEAFPNHPLHITHPLMPV